ncbi:MAG: hypothetical protein R3F43_11805 [bacterium]
MAFALLRRPAAAPPGPSPSMWQMRAGHAARGRIHFSREHLRHHGTPGYFSPAWQKALSAAVFVLNAGAFGWLVSTPPLGIAFGAGFGATYLLYEWVHWRIMAPLRAPSAAGPASTTSTTTSAIPR